MSENPVKRNMKKLLPKRNEYNWCNQCSVFAKCGGDIWIRSDYILWSVRCWRKGCSVVWPLDSQSKVQTYAEHNCHLVLMNNSECIFILSADNMPRLLQIEKVFTNPIRSIFDSLRHTTIERMIRIPIKMEMKYKLIKISKHCKTPK